MTRKQKKVLARIIIATVLMLILTVIPTNGAVGFILNLAVYLIIGYDILAKAFKGILNRQIFDENFLMCVATVGVFVLALNGRGDYFEASAVMLFYQIGELFQSCAVGKSRRNISELMDIRPDYANVEADGDIVTADPDDVEIGSIIVVQPGERVPIDGVVVSGKSSLNTTALTGESIPTTVEKGDEIASGCINLNGVLKIKTTKEFGESTVSKILELVENAGSKKSKSEKFISRFAKVYTPAVCYGALILALLPPIVMMLFGAEPHWGEWLYRALTFLVISCPCALVISIPLSFFAGIGSASRDGILIKGSNYLEALANTGYVVFDKTGTLTKGVFEVCEVHTSGIDEEKLIEYAAYAECCSAHPISRSIRLAYNKKIDRTRVSKIEEKSGKGVVAEVDGVTVAVGNDKLMSELGITAEIFDSIATTVYAAFDGKYAGYISISDKIKPTAKSAIERLRSVGVKNFAIFTGDMKSTAEFVGGELGISEIYSQLLPADKLDRLEEIIAVKNKKEKVVFVGDGINDAPVLSGADIGIAMGGIGSDAAIEAADVVIMDDDPMKIAKGIVKAKQCMKIVKQNIVFALGVKFICLILGALGIANLWLAIFADVGVMVIAVLNSVRILFAKKY